MSDRPRLAIIGSGISGLGAAFALQSRYHVTLFEAENRLGGHARTVEVGGTPVDTGFIVWNERNYPHLGGLFRLWDVPVVETNMSFGLSVGNGWLEYGTNPLSALFGQRRNLVRPRFWRLVRDILKFNREARQYLEDQSGLTLGQAIDEMGLGYWFRQYYLLAMGGAIWSCSPQAMLDFPVATFVRFFDNHGLLDIRNRPQWFTVKGGSREYIKRWQSAFQGGIRLSTPVQGVQPQDGGVLLRLSDGQEERFDQVILATHGDQALRLLSSPTHEQENVLGAFKTQPNQMILHSDPALMPKRRACWSSWVYRLNQTEDHNTSISVTYWMNLLQHIDERQPLFVSLNPEQRPRPELVHDEKTFHHPLFDAAAVAAQQRLPDIQGVGNIWFCGAWQRYGFHEDGLWSAARVAQSLGAELPWTPLH